jgi:phenylpropionate dioxygenase-like ring-hydroxylating dioxygenase large terminal subunit
MGRDDPEWPYSVHPTGWFQVAWSSELPAGGVIHRRYFDTDLVLFRDESGAVRVLDAHCAHLGAHLGYGGTVVGTDIVCPYHGWRWSGDGRNTYIPHSAHPHRDQRLRSWEVREHDDVIVVWHDAFGREPSWEPPTLADIVDGFELADYYPVQLTSRLWDDVRVRPQIVVENIVDAAHFQYVHSARSMTTIKEHHTEGPRFFVEHSFQSNRGAGLRIQTSGLGLMVGVFRNETGVTHVELQASTPIQQDRSDLRDSVWLRRHPSGSTMPTARQRSAVDRQLAELGNDVRIWEHLAYRKRAPLTPEETKPYRALRRWAGQFYPATAHG